MMPPARAAQRLLMGGGAAVLFAWAMGLQSGRTTVGGESGGTVILLLGAVLMLTGVALGQRSAAMLRLFPDEGDAAMEVRLQQEMADLEKDEQSSRAWARLEADALRSALDEEA
jgi:hypothetical protein